MSAKLPILSAVSAQRGRCWNFPAVCLAVGLATVGGLSSAVEGTAWFDGQGPTSAARQAVAVLSGAGADGLETRDYGAKELQQGIDSASSGQALTEERIARLTDALSSAMRRYLADLRFGRVDPQQLGAKYSPPATGDFSPDLLLQTAIAGDRLAEMAHSAAPRLPQYESLRQALAKYRELAGNPAWQQALPPLPGGKLAPGQAYAGNGLLTQRLLLLGDLPAGTTPPPRYEGTLVDGIKSFQQRHGRTPDGVIGAETFAQLKVPPEARVPQLELALERLRWTPLQQGRRSIVVNLPEFMLYAYQIRDDRIESGPAMRVVVGNARKTRTPLFDGEMRSIEFNPYWNVPPSITRGETLPRLRRDPAYFARQGFELVTGDGRVVSGLSEESLDALARGQVRIRQRPGAGNALGKIKFVFPNRDNIYLHHTPTLQLFKRDRRDFSHGCIRVEAPVDLARFVLADEPEWTRERIVQAMGKGRSMTIRLKEGLPVVIGYSTAVVRDGRVHFFPDLYGHDRILRDALRERSLAIREQASQRLAISLKSAN